MNTHKMNVASATQLNGGNSNVNLDRQFLGTAKIGQILPIFHQPCVPGDHFRVNINMFSRFLPLAAPSYVKVMYRTMSVFVPYHQVADGIESYLGNQKFFKGHENSIPLVQLAKFYEMYYAELSDTIISEESDIAYDYEYIIGGQNQYLKLGAVGRYIDKFLKCIGYRLPKSLNESTAQDIYVNALPLLCACHAYNSYMSYSPQYNTSQLSFILEEQKRNPQRTIEAEDLAVMLTSILLTYEESIQSLAWKNPFYSQGASEVSGAYKQTDILSVGDNNTVNFDGMDGSVYYNASDMLNAQQIRLLMKFDDYFRRSNYAGSKDIEQIYSRMGKRIDDYRTRYPYFLNESAREVNIGDVTSTSDSGDVPVGGYAGKAIGSGDAGFTFDSNDYGMLITFAWFSPKPVYYQGMDKEVIRLKPFDFYTPELDQGFPSPYTKEQCMEENAAVNLRDVVFGYIPLYSEDLYAKDVIVGDFTRFEEFKVWHFGRIIPNNATAQTDTLIYIPQSGSSDFEKIFNIADPTLVNSDVDSIFMTCDCRCSAIRPMKDFVGKTGLGSGNLDVPALGSQIN